MALKAMLETLDGLEPAIADLYAEIEDGKFVLEIEGDIKGHPATAGLESAFKKEQDKRKKQGRELEEATAKIEAVAWVPEDLTEEEFLRLKDADEDRGDGGGDGDEAEKIAAAVERATARLEAKHEREIKARDEALKASAESAAKFKTALETTKEESALTDALLKVRVAPHFMDAVKAMHRKALKTIEDDDEFKVVMGEDDETPEAFISEWALGEAGKYFVVAPTNNGGGAGGSGNNGGDGKSNPWKDDTFNRTEQARIANEDPARAKQLARQAGKPEPRV